MDIRNLLKKQISFYGVFFSIFIVMAILKIFGLYNINNNVISAFTIGTFLFTLSDLIEKDNIKLILFSFGMFSVIALPNGNKILDTINNFISQDVLMLISLGLVFFSLSINEIKSFDNKEKENILKKQSETIQYITKMHASDLNLAWSSIKDSINSDTKLIEEILKREDVSSEAKYKLEMVVKNNNLKNVKIEEGLEVFKKELEKFNK
ncbi:hypothetical protein C4D51_09335 [Clostridium perfringens]|nr:hypothetical protein [Clostridium perfringens]